jgi:hypothetical protein
VPNNREIAALIWMLVVVLLAARSQTIRSSAKQVAAQALQPAIAVPFLLVIGYIGAVVLGAAQLGIWTEDLLSETVLWGLGPGVGLLFSALEVSKGKRSVRQIARRAVGLTVAIEFFVNLYVFSLPVELLLVPLLTCAVLMSTVAGGRPEHAAVKRLLDGLLGAAGLGLMIYVAIRLGSDLGTVEGEALLRTLALPIWLTLVTIPFAFVFGSFLAYERALSIVDFMSDGRYRRWQTARALVLGLRFDLTAVSAFRGNWALELGQAASSSEAAEAVRNFAASRAAARRAEIDAQNRLDRYAGVSGTDDNGEQLDQREFQATRHALQTLATAQMGWYRNRGGRYREELADVLATSFTRAGLPTEHGIKVYVSADGDAWWAWRRTITGWCFAIGAAGPPDECPEQWQFDGPEPPSGFPGQDQMWGRPWGQDAVHW